MRLSLILLLLFFLFGCKSENSASTIPETSNIKAYEDLEYHPGVVNSLASKVTKIPPGSSIDEYQNTLKQTSFVETPYQHFKDYEYYWKLNTPDGYPSYILAGAFANGLIYSSINIIEESGGEWRTIWSIKHDIDSEITLKTRGLEPSQ